jgi:UDP:flavonoid glycosyltransferase YjiC (YdhE family)
VRTVLHDRTYAQRAEELRSEMASMPAIDVAVSLLEALAGR